MVVVTMKERARWFPPFPFYEWNRPLFVFKDSDHMVVFDDKSFLSGAPVNPLFLLRPFLLDDSFLARFTKEKEQRFLLDADFETAVFETGFIGYRKVRMVLEIFVDLVRALFNELCSPAPQTAATGGQEQSANEWQAHV
jgi:hypothetical protein